MSESVLGMQFEIFLHGSVVERTVFTRPRSVYSFLSKTGHSCADKSSIHSYGVPNNAFLILSAVVFPTLSSRVLFFLTVTCELI